jgi:hypothetical protein
VPRAAAFAFSYARAIRETRIHLTARARRICRAHADDITRMPVLAIRPPTERHNDARCELLYLNHDQLGGVS